MFVSAIPDIVPAISHPFVSSVYKKRDFRGRDEEKNVLIIKMRLPQAEDNSAAFKAALADLLMNLGELKDKAEMMTGKIDRIDIRA